MTQQKVRVLVVDDSVVVRLLVAQSLHANPQLELAGVANNGIHAIAKVDELKPDVVVLDVEMPEMDGLTALKAIRAKHRHLPIVMFSTLTSRGASATTGKASSMSAMGPCFISPPAYPSAWM